MVADVISFARGAPSLDIVDVAGLKAAAARAFDTDPGGLTGYGTSVGYPPLREWIARKHGVAPEQVLVTNGSLQADAFLFDAMVSAGDAVVVEKPTYDRTLLGLRNRGADVRPVTLDENGLDVAELEGLLAGGLRPTLAHVIPNFQNPAGMTLSAQRRSRLLELSGEYGFTVFEDDPYLDIRFDGEPLTTMLEQDKASGPERVVYASSFSKTVCPGVRVGYLIGSAERIAGIAKSATTTYISPSMVAQGIVHQFAVSGDLDRSIATVKVALRERAELLAEQLRVQLPEAQFTVPSGGYFLWVDLGPDVSVEKLLPAATERGVAVVKGTDFLLEGGENALRLAYSAVPADRIEQGVRRLADAVRDVRSSG